jgi:sulfoxide reductase heme-binding subunit YedZ
MAGLFAFFYGSLHLMTYVWLDQFFDVHSMAKDVVKRPFITAGFTAFCMMLPLAATSTAWAIRKLGGKRWQGLHRLVYVAGLAGVIHFWWLVKRDLTQPEIYATVFGALILYRVGVWLAAQRSEPAGVREGVAAD